MHGGRLSADRELARLRMALTVFFALDGLLFAGWVVRIPAIKAQVDASASDLGLALLGVSAGAVLTMTLTGRLCGRFGSRQVTVASAVLLSMGIALPPLTHSASALGSVLLVFGAGYGAINVAMNSVAVDLVTVLRRPVMPTFHAAFSLGGMLGAGLGGLVATQLSASRHLFLLALLGLVITAVTARPLLTLTLPPPPESTTAQPPPTASPVGGGAGDAQHPAAHGTGRNRTLVLVLGVIALCTAYGEGALADWSALHLAQDLGAGPGLAAAGYSVFALAMTTGRLGGAWLLQRLGEDRTLVAGGATAAVGMLVGSLAPSVWVALAGFVIAGCGLANIFPVVIGRAGGLAGPDGVAAASTLGYGGMLLSPVAIGFLADWFSLCLALTTVALLAAIAAAIAHLTQRAA